MKKKQGTVREIVPEIKRCRLKGISKNKMRGKG